MLSQEEAIPWRTVLSRFVSFRSVPCRLTCLLQRVNSTISWQSIKSSHYFVHYCVCSQMPTLWARSVRRDDVDFSKAFVDFVVDTEPSTFGKSKSHSPVWTLSIEHVRHLVANPNRRQQTILICGRNLFAATATTNFDSIWSRLKRRIAVRWRSIGRMERRSQMHPRSQDFWIGVDAKCGSEFSVK